MHKEKIIFVTGNEKKLEEAREILSDYDIQNIILDIDEIQGNAEDVARDKARKAFSIIKKPVFVDDTSLEYTALGGLPGVYVRSFLDNIGPDGLHHLLDGFPDKTAKAVCCIGFCDSEKEEDAKIFKGEIKGKIISPRGNNGFGFDRIFSPDGDIRTFSEMPDEEKNEISHRRRALWSFKEYLEEKNKEKNKK